MSAQVLIPQPAGRQSQTKKGTQVKDNTIQSTLQDRLRSGIYDSSFLPRASKVLEEVNRSSQRLKMDQWCSKDDAESIVIGSRRVHAIRIAYLQSMKNMSLFVGHSPSKILQKTSRKTELIKTIQAVKGCSSLVMNNSNSGGMDTCFATSMINSNMFYSDRFAPSDQACTSEEMTVTLVSQELLHLLMLSFLFVLYTDEPGEAQSKKNIGWDTLAALQFPAPKFHEQPRGHPSLKFVEQQYPDADGRGAPNFCVDPSWLCASAPFAICIHKLYFKQDLHHSWNQSIKEHVATASFLQLLNDIEAELQSQLELTSTLQAKVLSGISTLVFALLSLLMRHFQ